MDIIDPSDHRPRRNVLDFDRYLYGTENDDTRPPARVASFSLSILHAASILCLSWFGAVSHQPELSPITPNSRQKPDIRPAHAVAGYTC